MSRIDSRVAGLSPERRRLLQQLRDAPASPARAAVPAVAVPSGEEHPQRQMEPKRSCRDFFDVINQSLDSTEFGRFSQFLNFGYVPVEGAPAPERAAVALPDHIFNRNSVKLVLEVIGRCPLDHRRVLDVGCGRGGTAAVVAQFFKPRRFVGMDLSGRAVAFCHRSSVVASTEFVQGDAENLPFADASVDVAINIESSSTYPNLSKFFGEVFRVLDAGGDFLYSDVLPAHRASEAAVLLEAVGFDVEEDRDITPNVMRSCDEVARTRLQAYAAPGGAIGNFLGMPGSPVYEDMKSGRWTYRIMHLRKAVR